MKDADERQIKLSALGAITKNGQLIAKMAARIAGGIMADPTVPGSITIKQMAETSVDLALAIIVEIQERAR